MTVIGGSQATRPSIAPSIAIQVARIALKKGMEEYQRFLLVGEFESEHINDLAYMDASKVPVRCLDQHGRVVEDVWLLTYFETRSRLVVSYAVCVGEVTGQLTADVFLAAAMGRVVRVEELRAHGIECTQDKLLGGAAETLILDNALGHEGRLVRDATRLAGTNLMFGRPHMATDKAKQERFFGTLKRKLSDMPGWTKGAQTPSGRLSSQPTLRGPPGRPAAAAEGGGRDHLRGDRGIQLVPRGLDDGLHPHRAVHQRPDPAAPPGARTRLAPHARGRLLSGAAARGQGGPGLPHNQSSGLPRRYGRPGQGPARTARAPVLWRRTRLRRGETTRVLGPGRSQRTWRPHSKKARTARAILKAAGERQLLEGTPDIDLETATPEREVAAVARPAPRRRAEKVRAVVDPSAILERAWHGPPTESAA